MWDDMSIVIAVRRVKVRKARVDNCYSLTVTARGIVPKRTQKEGEGENVREDEGLVKMRGWWR